MQIHPEELEKLLNRSRIGHEEQAAVYGELEGRMSEVVNAATNPQQPEVARQALKLLDELTQNSDVRAARLWATLGAAGRAALVTAATSTAQPAVAEQALHLLASLADHSDVTGAGLWATLGAAGRAALVTAATSPAQPAVAVQALNFLTNLVGYSDVIDAEMWADLGAAGRAAIVTAATSTAQHAVADKALALLTVMAGIFNAIDTELWATLGAAGRAALVAAATSPAQPEVADKALLLLTALTVRSEVRDEELWTSLGAAGLAALVTAATSTAQPEVAEKALNLLTNLSGNSAVRGEEIWTSLGAAERAALVTAATSTSEPAVAEKALELLTAMAGNSVVIDAQLWATLGAAERAAVVTAATNPAQPAAAEKALILLSTLAASSVGIKVELWHLLQPRLAQLWAVTTQPSAAKQDAAVFLFNQIRGDAQRTSQALNVLNAAIPAISIRRSIDTLRGWGELVSRHEAAQLPLLTGIVQANISAQKMAVFLAAVMSGFNLWQHPLEEREALRDQLLAIPLAEGIDPTLYRQHMQLGFDAACGNTVAVIESKFLPAPEKLQLIEIIYSSREFLSAQVTQEELSKIQFTPHMSREFKLQAIELLLNHGKANSSQFKGILTWLKGEFKTDKHTVFTNPVTFGNISDTEIYALAEQRQQYLALYQNFRPHMTRDFIQAEIAEISQQVSTKEMPEDFGATLIFQLRQFLSTAKIDAGVNDDGRYDSKSESK
ncbi:hypothetical protein [Polaromonas vacuolata]|uniref:hypothetical protein n=1 Tax=Polaromonas vacuolata TaxID=37448 RepID=UPI001456B10D|nr:hypothetical protein [Polaromonas vacuolata]